MRPEQVRAVERTADYFRKAKSDEPGRVPKFLWNAKMRFGKTFASYELAKKMGLSRILVLTFKPAVESAWREDLVTHVDFDGWQFVSNKDAHMGDMNIDRQYEMADKSRPIVVFGSFRICSGRMKRAVSRQKRIHPYHQLGSGDFDEYHFGAWRENARKLFENPDEEESADFDAENTVWKKRETPTMKPFAHYNKLLSVSLGYAFPRHQFGRIHRRSDLQLDLFRRATRQGKLGRFGQSVSVPAAHGHADLPHPRQHPSDRHAGGIQ